MNEEMLSKFMAMMTDTMKGIEEWRTWRAEETARLKAEGEEGQAARYFIARRQAAEQEEKEAADRLKTMLK